MADTNLLQGISNLSSAISPVANVGSQLLNIHFQKQENERNRTFADSQNTLAFQRQQQLLAEQRSFDSPKAQMQRLLEAGLNPNLIYGSNPQSPMQAMNAPNNATAAANQVAPQIDPLSFSQSLLNMANVKKVNQETELSNAKTREILGDTPYAKANIANINATTQTLVQQFNLNRLEEYKVQLLYDYATDDNKLTITTIDPQGNEFILTSSHAEEFKSKFIGSILNNFRILDNQATISDADAAHAWQYFLYRAYEQEYNAENVKLENQDLRLFLEYAAEYYKALFDEQSAIASMAQDDNAWVSKFGGREAFHALSGLASDVIDIAKSFIKRVPSKPSKTKSKSSRKN